MQSSEQADCLIQYERYFKNHPDADACIQLPFKCDHCGHQRFHLEMIGGDGDLICTVCFESYVAALEGKPAGRVVE